MARYFFFLSALRARACFGFFLVVPAGVTARGSLCKEAMLDIYNGGIDILIILITMGTGKGDLGYKQSGVMSRES